MYFSKKLKNKTSQKIIEQEQEEIKKIRKNQAFIIRQIRKLCLEASEQGLFYVEIDELTLPNQWAWTEEGECYIYFVLRKLNLNWVKLEAEEKQITGFGISKRIIAVWVE